MMEPGLLPLTTREEAARAPVWARFEADWYLGRYPDAAARLAGGEFASAEAYYREIGEQYGHSPNRYFDEEWYRRAYPAVYRAICTGAVVSGFAHYLDGGYADHSPHWLFDELYYRRRNPAVALLVGPGRPYRNGYDHFLAEGDRDGMGGHPFYDPALAGALLASEGGMSEGASPFSVWLTAGLERRNSGRISWYFDPVWYCRHYTAVARDIEAGGYSCALHHYLTNDSPQDFDPQPWFNEAYYREVYPDLAPSLQGGVLRNGYDHFVRFGVWEGRSPAREIDLVAYARKPLVAAELLGGPHANSFEHYVAADIAGRAAWYDMTVPEEAQTRALFRQDAESALAIYRYRGLDFTVRGAPEVSVIVVLHEQIALTMQTLSSLRANFAGAIELVLVDSGSHDETREIEEFVRGARLLRSRANVGYLDGCNAALSAVTADAVLYLNNDVRLYPGAVAHARSRLYASVDIGAVAAKIVRTHFQLQEAGSVVWRDGATYGYRREDDPNIAEANFVRDVDYGSAAFMLARTSVVRALGGFDVRFRPAYFEDTDLCLRISAAGYRIVYDPAVVIEHLEFGSSGTSRSQAMIKANHRLFAQTHAETLRSHPPRHVRNAVFAREHRAGRKRILYLEDRLPLARLGSGYSRSNDIVRAMDELGYHVTVFPILPRRVPLSALTGEFPEGVELMYEADLGDLPEFIAERAGYYDVLWVGRVHNMARILPVVSELARHLPAGGAILDTEVVATPRSFERARILGEELPVPDFDTALTDELECAHYCQRIVAVTTSDAALIRRAGYDNVSVLGHEMTARPTPAGFHARRDFLVVGALHDEGAPNFDGLVWLVREVLPHLDALLPPEVTITVAGYASAHVDVSLFASHPCIRWVGPQDDLEALYATHRVFVAPTRFAGGLPYKIHEAASFGLPIVTTTLIAGQVAWRRGEALLAAPADEPADFAAAMFELYTDEAAWGRIRDAALGHIRRECDPARFNAALDEILRAVVT